MSLLGSFEDSRMWNLEEQEGEEQINLKSELPRLQKDIFTCRNNLETVAFPRVKEGEKWGIIGGLEVGAGPRERRNVLRSQLVVMVTAEP